MKGWSRNLAIAAAILAGLLTLYELTWVSRSGVAWVLVGLGASVVLLSVAVVLGTGGGNDKGGRAS